MTIHPLVTQLRFTRSELARCLEGVSDADARRRFEPMNCISWIVGHLADQENRYWVMVAQGQKLFPDLSERVGWRKPASTPPLEEMWTAWRAITEVADRYLDTVTPDVLLTHLEWNGKTLPDNVGTMILRNIHHYWFHIGEAYAVRQLLGHTDLPEFVGDMTEARYYKEGIRDESILYDDIADPDFRLLGEQVVAAMQRLPVPGVAVGLLHKGQEHVAGFGVTSIEHPLPVNADTLFQIGSITKTFVGTAVMRLVEMGKLNLDTPLRAYLPDLHLASEETARQVTLRHVVTHTGGWVGDYFDDLGPGDDALAQMVARMADLEQLTPLGTIWSYNNSGFYLAGRVIEVVTGKTFEAAIKELVLNPLGLSMSLFFAADVISHRFAVGHQVVDKEPQVARPWAMGRAIHPAGGIISNIKDLLRYARFHMGDGSTPDGARLLTPESMTLMQSPLVPGSGMTDAVGVTWMLTKADDTWVVRHGGGTNGQTTEIRLVPARGFAIAILTNSDEGGELCDEIAQWAMRHYLGIAMPQAIPLDLPEEKLAQYAGRYESAADMGEISLREGELILQVTYKGGFPTQDTPPPPSPPPVRLALYGEDRVVALDSPMRDDRGEFLRNPDGSIAWFRFGGRIHTRKL